MRHHRSRCSLILLPVVLAGCSTTAGSRLGKSTQAPSQSRSIAVVGDRPMPATTGEPGAQVAADEVEPEPRRNPKTRISGRVVDDQGEPVSGVTVRLADGGTRGGKDVGATTDRSGAFTLNGLRPGSTYWLVAEADDDRGPLTGRVQARTAQTGVEISLAGDDPGAAATTRRSARPSRVRPISNVEEPDEGPADRGPTGVNAEDLAPPAEDAGAIDPGPSSGPSPKSRSGRPQLSAPEPAAGWHNSKSAKPVRPTDPDEESVASTSAGPPRRPRPTQDDDPAAEDDGPNPLPPAIDSGDPDDAETKPTPSARSGSRRKVGARAPAPRPDSGEISLAPEASADDRQALDRAEAMVALATGTGLPAMAPLTPRPAPGPSPDEPIVAAGPPALPPIGGVSIAELEEPKPTASPPEVAPVSHEVASNQPASQPAFASQAVAPKAEPMPAPAPEPPAEYNPFALASATPLVPAQAKGPAPASNPDPSPVLEGPPDVAAPPKKKWGELAATDRPPMVVEPTRAVSPISFVRRLRGPAEKREPAVALCSYDSRLQKINELRLPDLDGKPVRLQDLDADFVLLDFWGTWFPPCVGAIPHLMDLQKQYGPSRLRVVGIACEKVPVSQRKARVDEVSRKLGINYAVLLSGMDDKPCPVLQALQVQSYPTMMLVDREGRIRWRSVGATPATEYRLDRILATMIGRTPPSTATARR